jgi:acetolactate synthase-1/2/3 large subunit
VTLADSAYEKVAEAFGGFGARADTLEEIREAIASALAGGKPSCINIRIDGSIINPVTMNMVGIKPGSKPAATEPDAGDSDTKVVMPYYDNVD